MSCISILYIYVDRLVVHVGLVGILAGVGRFVTLDGDISGEFLLCTLSGIITMTGCGLAIDSEDPYVPLPRVTP